MYRCAYDTLRDTALRKEAAAAAAAVTGSPSAISRLSRAVNARARGGRIYFDGDDGRCCAGAACEELVSLCSRA